MAGGTVRCMPDSCSPSVTEQQVALRKERGLTQVQAAIRAGLAVHRYAHIEAGNPTVLLSELCAAARAVGGELRFVPSNETVGTDPIDLCAPIDLDGPGRSVVDGIPDSEDSLEAGTVGLGGALDELAGLARRKRRRAPVCIVVSSVYARQVEREVWGEVAVDSRWEELDGWNGIPVSVQPGLGIEAKLVRQRPSARWPEAIASVLIGDERDRWLYDRMLAAGTGADRAAATVSLVTESDEDGVR